MADRAFDWNDIIENDGGEFITLPAGTYPFSVKSFERGAHAGSDGIPPCKKAVLTLEVDGGVLGTTEIRENLYLHSRAEWKLCQFFTGIGMRKRGEHLRMDWNRIVGARGLCEIAVQKRTSKQGREYEANQVARYIDPETAPKPAQTAQAQAGGGGFTPGTF